jgi:heme-degrading monooxygenase HmoA
MIERHVRFTVPHEGVDAFRNFFESRYLPAIGRFRGFVSARLLRPSNRDGLVLLIVRFIDYESHALWRESEEHSEVQTSLAQLHSGMQFEGYEDL